ncbi:hypothetical protein [Myxococcus sp. RHSTA-1-4]|uniref:hypothetical protein n=1 Tax=Myxococcus sp. RHSTA-1-4 TaxID=2874601 RepID=UPI001CBE3B6B|nr:hypothetical protein [Myxococcus sp. RHSTA-1-4]MBZ4415284.1 hypothetical protein [Myxococcus sp. RHSTA-1-4]
MSREKQWEFGEQRAWVELPDILWARFRGAVTLETSQWSCGVYREMSEAGRFYLAAEITGSHLSPESRRYLVEHAKADWFRGIVYIGAGLDQKASTKSLMVGSILSGGKPLDVLYVDSPEQAREWIAQHRALNPERSR